MKNFKEFEITNLDVIKAGKIKVIWVGSDGNGNSLMDLEDTETGKHHCSVNDYDLTFKEGDVMGGINGGSSGGGVSSQELSAPMAMGAAEYL